MTTIRLITKIKAPLQIVFDLARDIDVHQEAASATREKAIAGRTSGPIALGETVTWRGKHFGLYLQHQSLITEMEHPTYFVDEMKSGHFKSFRHEHSFVSNKETTVMIDHLEYETPMGIFGKGFDKWMLERHLTQFLLNRNKALKTLAEHQQ
jgi:ligand-binding SRPBCC domain-containing protein